MIYVMHGAMRFVSCTCDEHWEYAVGGQIVTKFLRIQRPLPTFLRTGRQLIARTDLEQVTASTHLRGRTGRMLQDHWRLWGRERNERKEA